MAYIRFMISVATSSISYLSLSYCTYTTTAPEAILILLISLTAPTVFFTFLFKTSTKFLKLDNELSSPDSSRPSLIIAVYSAFKKPSGLVVLP